MIGDQWKESFPPKYPNIYPYVDPVNTGGTVVLPVVSRQEFDALKAEVESLKKLLRAAKIYDEETGQPDCEMDDKVALIKKIAEFVGVDMKDVFK
jgi:hypothetical protein